MAARDNVNDKEISEFRKRVESWRASFPTRTETVLARRPLIVEVCGTPKAGKSALTQYVAHLFRRCGLKTCVITEPAEVNPLPEKIDPSFNVWNLTSVLSKLLTAVDGNYHIVLIDRGLLDCIAWLRWHYERSFVSQEELDTVGQFIRFTRWWSLLDLVIAVIVPPLVALDREPFGTKLNPTRPTESGDVPRVMQTDVLEQYNRALESVLTSLEKPENRPPVWRLDMTKNRLESAALTAAQKILSVAEGIVPEKILVLRRGGVSRDLFRPGFRPNDDTVNQFIRAVDSESLPVHRPTAEERPLEYVQPIALGVIKHEDKVLLLRRKETDEGSYMHDRYVICAGGHLRSEDRGDGRPGTLERGLQRELLEELRLPDADVTRLIGLVYDTNLTRYLGHIGVVYEVPLAKEEAVLARSQTEFKERRGTGVSCTFVSVKELHNYYNEMDEWSKHIASGLFGIRRDDRSKQAMLF